MLVLMSGMSVQATSINEINAIPKYELSGSGFSGDIAVSPFDGSVHAIWVTHSYILQYSRRVGSGGWSPPQDLTDRGSFIVFGQEEAMTKKTPRKCAGITVDNQGGVHVVFAEESGDLYYMNGYNNNWSPPVKIADKTASTVYPDIAASSGNLYVAYEHSEATSIIDESTVYTVIFRHGVWEDPVSMGAGEYPSITAGSNGNVYFICRDYGQPSNVKFAFMRPWETGWNHIGEISDVPHVKDEDGRNDRVGQGPGFTVSEGYIYVAWGYTNMPGAPDKQSMYCARAAEPGGLWEARWGGSAIYYDNTSSPHVRVDAYSDGTLIYMNGGRTERFAINSKGSWSATRPAPWDDEDDTGDKIIIETASDGRTVWVISCLAGYNDGQVAVSGLSNPDADYFNPSFSADVDDLNIITKRDLDYDGFSADCAVHPKTGALHVAWVNNGDIKYRIRETDGDWPGSEIIPDGGLNVYGQDAGGNPRICVGLDIDKQGTSHVVFITDNGNVWYLNGTSGNWGAPQQIAEGGPYSIFPAIRATGNHLVVVYENGGQIYSVSRIGGVWGTAAPVGTGDYPSLAKGGNGMVYLAFRSADAGADVRSAWQIPGYTGWNFTGFATDATDEVGGGPALAVYGDTLYLAWNNNTGEVTEQKSEIFCASKNSPQEDWTPRFGAYYPLYYEDTGDPHPRAGVYSDGNVLLVNGRRSQPRFVLWNGSFWSSTRNAPWAGGIPRTASDGQTIWVAVSSTSESADEVSVTGISSPDAAFMDLSNRAPVISSTPSGTALENTLWQYHCTASDQDDDDLAYRLVVSPDMMTIDPESGQVTWTPETGDAGRDPWNHGTGAFLAGIQVSDGRGGHAVQYFWITVEEGNHDPVITSTPVTTAKADSLYTYQVTAIDEDGDPVVYSLSQKPGGMIIHSQSGLISWTPGSGDTGDHAVAVTAADTRGGEAVQNYTLRVEETVIPAPVAGFAADVTAGFAPLTVQFTDQSTGQITSRLWDFGDGTTDARVHPDHVYGSEGRYTVRLIVAGPGGSDTLTRAEYITVQTRPVAGFIAAVTEGTRPLDVQFVNQSTGDITSYYWDFGDGNASIQENPHHIYTATGQYTVRLIVSGPAGSDTLTRPDYISVSDTPPEAAFGAAPRTGEGPLTVHFTDSSSGIVTRWLWRFGDDSVSTQKNPVHTYYLPGQFTVRLVVSGPGGSDSLTQMNYIHVDAGDLTAGFEADPLIGMAPLAVQFTDTSKGMVSSRLWSFGDNTTSELQNPAHVYAADGTYTVSLTVAGPAGIDIETKTAYIHVQTTSVGQDAGGPAEFRLHPCFPNPFNPGTTIRYDLAGTVHVKISVFDMMGKCVAVPENGIKPAGSHSTFWQAENNGLPLPSGVYVIHFEAGDYRERNKVMLIK